MQYGQSHVEAVKRDSRAFLEFGLSVVATIFALLWATSLRLSLIHISEPTRHICLSRMPSSA